MFFCLCVQHPYKRLSVTPSLAEGEERIALTTIPKPTYTPKGPLQSQKAAHSVISISNVHWGGIWKSWVVFVIDLTIKIL